MSYVAPCPSLCEGWHPSRVPALDKGGRKLARLPLPRRDVYGVMPGPALTNENCTHRYTRNLNLKQTHCTTTCTTINTNSLQQKNFPGTPKCYAVLPHHQQVVESGLDDFSRGAEAPNSCSVVPMPWPCRNTYLVLLHHYFLFAILRCYTQGIYSLYIPSTAMR